MVIVQLDAHCPTGCSLSECTCVHVHFVHVLYLCVSGVTYEHVYVRRKVRTRTIRGLYCANLGSSLSTVNPIYTRTTAYAAHSTCLSSWLKAHCISFQKCSFTSFLQMKLTMICMYTYVHVHVSGLHLGGGGADMHVHICTCTCIRVAFRGGGGRRGAFAPPL